MVKSIIVSLILDFFPLKTKDRSLSVLAQNFRKKHNGQRKKKMSIISKTCLLLQQRVDEQQKQSQKRGKHAKGY